ncbi:uncharacterized protein LOC110443853 [Mizuhopecten yessoensis]|uniref:uncharacterized protein LOC110443853 n=1 Tax=Mizuhopecten yessoensis TaxID=6573 RepID=UPI000B45CC99|nr:uncharacterized protein LOC110443853 [Mizuhopecten yessoensis]
MIAPELEDVVDVMHACAKIGGQEGYTPEQRYLVWRAVILDEALEFVKATIEHSEGSYRRILDIGCGQGDFTIRLAEEFATKSVHGCDVSPINTQRCIDKSFDVHNTAFFTVPNIAELPPSWSTVYDVVAVFQPVPHGSTNTREVILEAARILQDDGFIIYIEQEVSINPSDKRFPESAYDLAVSYWYCLPSGLPSVPKNEYLVENTENFLSDCGLRVQSHHVLHCSIWNHAFVCIKK